jgi:sugar fermentation stimulation protein A
MKSTVSTKTEGKPDSGAYVLVIFIPRETKIRIGALGAIDFHAGYYVYTGSGKKNLSSRISRHLRKTKKLHWHIDYLTMYADWIQAFPIYTIIDLECRLSREIGDLTKRYVAGFGCSDCPCDSHCFYFEKNPIEEARFIEIVTSLHTER